jgi:hypothetical protein
MKHIEEPAVAAFGPPHAGWVLRATRQLKFGDQVVQRGHEVTSEMLAASANAALLSGRHIVWSPPVLPTPKVTPPPPVPRSAAGLPFVDPIAALRFEIKRKPAPTLRRRSTWSTPIFTGSRRSFLLISRARQPTAVLARASPRYRLAPARRGGQSVVFTSTCWKC